MSLTDLVKKELGSLKGFFTTPKTKDDMRDYLVNNMSDYFNGKTTPEKEDMYNRLDKHIDNKFDKYHEYLGNWYDRAGKLGGIATTISDAYQAFLAKVPLTGAQYLPIHKLLIMGKTIPEAVYMSKYFKDSKDVYGLVKWLGMKPIELAVPILGPMLGTGYTEKIVRQRIMKEAKDDFLKEVGVYKDEPGYNILDKLDKFASDKTGYKINPRSDYGKFGYGVAPAYR